MTENQTPSFKLYSIAEITISTYFGGPLVAGWFARQNYINLGKKDAGNWALIIGIILTIFIIIGIIEIPQNIFDKIPNPLIPAIYTGIIYFLIKNLQGEAIEEHKKKNGEFYSVWNVVGISLLCAIILAAMFFGFAYLLPESNGGEKNDTSFKQDVGSLTDQDNNVYKTITIGPQIWMKENLKTTKYNDGTPVPLVTNGTTWSHLSSGAYCLYNNDSLNKNTYGALYNWYAVYTGKLCPSGWHVPCEKEWDDLVQSFEDWSHKGEELREKGKSHWHHSPNTKATNKSGFTALPGGHRSRFLFEDDTIDFLKRYDYEDIDNFRDTTWRFYGIGFSGYWWGFDGNSFNDNAYTVCLRYYYSAIPARNSDFMDKKEGLSVRCLKYNMTVTQDGLPFTEPEYGETVKDQDSNTYKTIVIGTQTWMAENLKTTKFNNGKAIALLTSDDDWSNVNSSGYCWYDNNPTYKNDYGALYNWYAVQTGKLCPAGWHIPSDKEWTILTDYLGGEAVSAGKLKETWFQHWSKPNNGATNETGFTALPGGYREYEYGGFIRDLGEAGKWWSSTRLESNYAWCRYMNLDDNTLYRGNYDKGEGLSVRCIKN
ncbi:MAG: hypothetical protein NTZ85_01295 [Bacteroidia bacterium]|nr:hypothetical protein [Bacteroidia bacterium]